MIDVPGVGNCLIHLGVSMVMGVPQARWMVWENPILKRMMNPGYPHDHGNIHLLVKIPRIPFWRYDQKPEASKHLCRCQHGDGAFLQERLRRVRKLRVGDALSSQGFKKRSLYGSHGSSNPWFSMANLGVSSSSWGYPKMVDL